MNKKDKNKKDLSVWGTIAVVFALLSSFSDIMDDSAFVILIAIAVFIVVAVALAKAAKKAGASAERGGISLPAQCRRVRRRKIPSSSLRGGMCRR